MLHRALFLAIELAAAGVIGWLGDELLCSPLESGPRPKPKPRRKTSPAVQQQAIRNIDHITATAIAHMLRVAGEELPDA